MPTLTIAAIRANPSNVLTHELPAYPDRLLLQIALLAADYIRCSEYNLMMAVRRREYVPAGWERVDDACDAHEENEAAWFEADRKIAEIENLYLREFGERLERG